MTGVEINQIYSQQIGQTYSGIEDIPKKNRRFKKALINAIEEKYRNLNEQREFEEYTRMVNEQNARPPNQPSERTEPLDRWTDPQTGIVYVEVP